MLASMSVIDPHGAVGWSDLGVNALLPTGIVTLLLADVEGSTRLWETKPDEMTAAVARLNQTVSKVIAAYGGVRPVEQGEGDSFVAAFACASDAVACALELQRAPLSPIRLRIGVHTGEVQLRDEGNYAGALDRQQHHRSPSSPPRQSMPASMRGPQPPPSLGATIHVSRKASNEEQQIWPASLLRIFPSPNRDNRPPAPRHDSVCCNLSPACRAGVVNGGSHAAGNVRGCGPKNWLS
jgi:hypothetical protein